MLFEESLGFLVLGVYVCQEFSGVLLSQQTKSLGAVAPSVEGVKDKQPHFSLIRNIDSPHPCAVFFYEIPNMVWVTIEEGNVLFPCGKILVADTLVCRSFFQQFVENSFRGRYFIDVNKSHFLKIQQVQLSNPSVL